MAQDNSIPLQAFQGQSPVDNFLSSYSASQQQAQGNEMHKRKIGALDQADEERKRQLVADALIAVPDGDQAGFEQVKQNLVNQRVIDQQTAAMYDISKLPQLKLMSQKWREMKTFEMEQQRGVQLGRLTEAQIGATNRSNRPRPSGGGGGGFSSPVGEGDGLNPYEGITDPKQRDIMYRQLMTDFNSRQKDYQQTRVEAQNIIASTDEFLALNKKVGSGGVTGSGGLSSVPIVNSARNMVDSDWARMNAITDKLTPLMRQGLPGAASDRDMQTFRGATVGTGKLGEANVGIARGLQVAAKNAIDKGLFDEAYFRRNRHLQGSDNAWSRYLEENPIFDPRSDPTNPELNRSRKSWREYVSPSAQAAPSPTQQTGGIVPGTVEDGYVFRGGDPSNPANWSEAQ